MSLSRLAHAKGLFNGDTNVAQDSALAYLLAYDRHQQVQIERTRALNHFVSTLVALHPADSETILHAISESELALSEEELNEYEDGFSEDEIEGMLEMMKRAGFASL